MEKNWDWTQYKGNRYLIPAREIYYLLPRWEELGGGRILDIGCGLGRHSILFAENGFNVYAFDKSEVALNALKQNLEGNPCKKRVHILQGDLDDALPFENNFFDFLIGYHVISHTDSMMIKKTIKELYRVMKPGGELFMSFCSKRSRFFTKDYKEKIDENTIIKNVSGPEEGIPHYYSDNHSLAELLKEFEMIDMFHVEYYAELGEMLEDNKHYFVLCRKGKIDAG